MFIFYGTHGGVVLINDAEGLAKVVTVIWVGTTIVGTGDGVSTGTVTWIDWLFFCRRIESKNIKIPVVSVPITRKIILIAGFFLE